MVSFLTGLRSTAAGRTPALQGGEASHPEGMVRALDVLLRFWHGWAIGVFHRMRS